METEQDTFLACYEAIRRFAERGIAIQPAPRHEGGGYLDVIWSTPSGHYISLNEDCAEVTAVNEYRDETGFYNDMIPGYQLIDVIQLEPYPPEAAPGGIASFNIFYMAQRLVPEDIDAFRAALKMEREQTNPGVLG